MWLYEAMHWVESSDKRAPLLQQPAVKLSKGNASKKAEGRWVPAAVQAGMWSCLCHRLGSIS